MSITPPDHAARLLAGPPPAAGAESFHDHRLRLGPLPPAAPGLLRTLEHSGLLGRGGAAFPAARKWAAVAREAGGDARVLANGAEGEPLSAKDRTLLAARPHLVLDGAFLAADAVGAREIVLYVGENHRAARRALERALVERGRTRVRARLVSAPDAFVAGEETAAVHYINDGDARPTSKPPRPFERGIGGRPTLVHNVETLAHVALIARFGETWHRSAGRGPTRGTTVVTVQRDGRSTVSEVELGMRLGEVAGGAGARPDATSAVLLGGYHGTWLPREEAWPLPLDPVGLRAANATLGTGVIGLLPRDACGVTSSARIVDYLAAQSAAQCGPCVFGLRAIADAMLALADVRATPDDLARVTRWTRVLTGRGACRHPDGAAVMLDSALACFADDFEAHARRRGCLLRRQRRFAA
jgi:NADH:ubiquinone oxidoreductase subunit F (NADH-binding)